MLKVLLNPTKLKLISHHQVKTTSPEKYRVRPSAGYVSPGNKEVVHVYLVYGEWELDKLICIILCYPNKFNISTYINTQILCV